MFVLSLSVGAVVLILLSVMLLLLACWICHWQGIFENFDDYLGLGVVFAALVFCVVWIAPSLLAWAVWATWLR